MLTIHVHIHVCILKVPQEFHWIHENATAMSPFKYPKHAENVNSHHKAVRSQLGNRITHNTPSQKTQEREREIRLHAIQNFKVTKTIVSDYYRPTPLQQPRLQLHYRITPTCSACRKRPWFEKGVGCTTCTCISRKNEGCILGQWKITTGIRCHGSLNH